jgi:hypothetical protein
MGGGSSREQWPATSSLSCVGSARTGSPPWGMIGSICCLRAALDHAEVVTHLAVLDAVPIGRALSRTDATFTQA